MTKDKLNMLKEKLRTGSSFQEAYDFFFDHFGYEPAFIDASKRTEDELLEALVRQVALQVLGKTKGELVSPLYLEHREFGIKHGAGFLTNYLVTYFFVEEAGCGLLAVAKGLNDRNVKIARFSGEFFSPGEGKSHFMPPKKEQSN